MMINQNEHLNVSKKYFENYNVEKYEKNNHCKKKEAFIKQL